MIEGKWFLQGSDIAVPLALREAVFARGRDALDDGAQQLVVYQSGVPVGTARLLWRDGDFVADGIGVLPAQRGKGFGDLLVRLLLYKVESHNAKSLVITCPAACAPYFARYGFAAETQGESLTLRAQLADGCPTCTGCGGCKGNTQ